ncbi:MAG TPA: VWA domain-containing protein, partial [Urbifossiella sp.]|nr:VWA domain-containing protein [Urbifossiella sp.]
MAPPKKTTAAAKAPAAPKAPAKAVAKPPAARGKKASLTPEAGPTPLLVRPTGPTKFTLYNLLGEPRAYYLVEPKELDRPAPDPKRKTVAHSVIVVDRSGSMYGAMADTRDTLLKLLTLDEYAQFDIVVTLISYSSQGDATAHFERAPIREIMKPGSKYQQEIKRLQVTGATCISGGLRLALEKIQPDELTAVTVHSDGYANDPSANAEAATLMTLVAGLKSTDAFVNTIAYTDYSDFRLLNRLANAGSGACVKAGNIAQVYNSLYSSTKVLGSAVTPPIDVPLGTGFDYQVFVSRSAARVNGTAGGLSVRGLKDEDDAVVYKYRKLTRAEYDKLDAPEAQTTEAVFAFSRANLADGNLNTAKYALASTFDATLAIPHARALTNNQSAAFAADLDTLLLLNPSEIAGHTVLTEVPVNRRIPLLSLVKTLDAHRAGFTINRKALQDVYVRRGLKRLPWSRDDAGNLVEPTLKTEFVGDDEY